MAYCSVRPYGSRGIDRKSFKIPECGSAVQVGRGMCLGSREGISYVDGGVQSEKMGRGHQGVTEGSVEKTVSTTTVLDLCHQATKPGLTTVPWVWGEDS